MVKFLGFAYVFLPIAVIAIVGLVYSWNYEKVIASLPHDPVAMGAVGFAGLYVIHFLWMIYKAVRVAKVKAKGIDLDGL
jgi:hypothetical protein